MEDLITQKEYRRFLLDNDNLGLKEADMPEILEIKENLNVNDSNCIMQYGTDVQKRLAELPQMMIHNINDSNAEEVDAVLNNAVAYLTGFTKESKKKQSRFGKKKSDPLVVQSRYDAAVAQVNVISEALEQHQVKLIMDRAFLDQIRSMNSEYYHQLTLRIAAAKLRLAEIKDVLNNKYTGPLEDQGQVDRAWLQSVCTRLEKKLSDLELTRILSMQQNTQIALLQNNSAMMSEKLQSTLYNTIPLWKNRIILFANAEHAGKKAKTDRKLEEASNKFLLESLGELTAASAESHKAETELENVSEQIKDKMEE